MHYIDTDFSDIKLLRDDSGGFLGVLTPDGIEASPAESAFLSDRRVLSSLEQARHSIGRILRSQLGLELPRGFSIPVCENDFAVFCTQMCGVEYMDRYLERKRAETLAAAEVWNRERPWDTNPMTLREAGLHKYTFDAETGELGTDGHFNPERELELPSSIDGARVTAIRTSAFVSNTFLESVIIPESVTRIEPYAFYDKVHLRYANIPSGVSVIPEGMFGRCRALASIVIPGGVRRICDEAFYHCSSLDTVVIPDSVEYIGRCAFLGVPHIIYGGSARGFPWGATVGG